MRIRSLTTFGALPLALIDAVSARVLHSLPEDPAAFPKFSVSYMNGFPILNTTAETWLAEGLRGGEAEFLEQPWEENDHQWARTSERKEIGAGEDAQYVMDAPTSGFRLEHMKLGPKLDFLCLLPPPLEIVEPDPSEVEAEHSIDPVHAWSLLQPLAGGCLYHRQAWFTYAYCHNSHIRQFREAAHTHPHSPGGYVPQEDTEWEAYTLGQAPPAPSPGTDVTVAERARAAHVELARGAGPTYLVLRWGDGTVCDKTGRRRDIEIQFHCGMAGPDAILFVKETRTCSYVTVVHTPRLCSLPGFRAPADAEKQAEIRCRQIVDVIPPSGDINLLAGDGPHPAALPPKKLPVLVPPVVAPLVVDNKASSVKKLLDRLMGVQGGDRVAEGLGDALVLEQTEDGALVLELTEDMLADLGYDLDDSYGYDADGAGGAEGYGYAQGGDAYGNDDQVRSSSLLEVLKAAGYDVQGMADARLSKNKRRQDSDEQDEDAEFVDGL